MPFEAILSEVEQLHGVSRRLEGLAERHPPVSSELTLVANNVRDTAAYWRCWWLPRIPS